MTPPFFSSLRQALLSLCRISHSISRRRYSAGGKPVLEFLRQEIQDLKSLERVSTPSTAGIEQTAQKEGNTRLMEISHPWPEWVDLMEHVLKKGYLDRGTFQSSSSPCSSSKEFNKIRTACLTFARESPELIRHLSRRDIQIIVESGCPSIDKKVINSGKRLRAYVGTDEGKVCNSCKLRGNCERAYMKPNEDEQGRTVDVMRTLLSYGFDTMYRSVVDEPSFSHRVQDSTRKLFKDIVNLSIKGYDSIPEDSHVTEKVHSNIPMRPGDWVCPGCNFMNFAKNIKCLSCAGLFEERLAKLRQDRDHLPLKKGDWICAKCNFFNFAKNVKCVQCDEKATNRILNPGEWECESCCYINFRKNYYCLKCGWKRPKASRVEHDSTESHTINQHNNLSESTYSQFLYNKSSDFSSFRKYIVRKNADINADDDDDFRSSAEFCDFPVVGGKSVISKDGAARERWKEEISAGKKGSSFKNGDGTLPSSSFKVIAREEDDDIAGWFGE